MKDPRDKYEMFKNFMHNELGISRDEIRQWVREAVADEARRIVAQEFGKFDPAQIVKNFMFEEIYWGQKQLQEDCRKLLVEVLTSKIKMTLAE
jgi:hypothetical protein